jgi:signal transduction histidine kinase
MDPLIDERRMMGRWSGALWLLGAAVGAACQPLPGVSHDHELLAWIMIAAVALYGIACIVEWIPWRRAPLWLHLVAVLAFQPVLGVALWASGGINSYIFPVLVLAMLYAAYFLPGWMAWVGVGALAVTWASTLLYTPIDEDQALARVLAFALACEGMTLTLQTLKRRLISAEQRVARLTPEPIGPATGAEAADAALRLAIAQAGDPRRARRASDPGQVVLLGVRVGFDPRGDALEALADHIRASVRPGDIVARISAAELAIVLLDAGGPGARRLAQSTHVAAARELLTVRVAWAIHPDDGVSAEALQASVRGALDSGDEATAS